MSTGTNNSINTHITFSSDTDTNTFTTSTVYASQHHRSRSKSVICQPFSLKTAYPFFAGEKIARRQGSNRSPKGAPWTTFHSGGKLVCDYIFHGHLRVPITPSLTADLTSSGTAPPVAQRLQVDAILELPCAELHRNGVQSLPSKECGSDHLSLAARFKFV
jgi:hypothetical protein